MDGYTRSGAAHYPKSFGAVYGNRLIGTRNSKSRWELHRAAHAQHAVPPPQLRFGAYSAGGSVDRR